MEFVVSMKQKGGCEEMALIKENPWSIKTLSKDDLDLPVIEEGLSEVGQGLNIYETEKEIVVEVAVPGIPEDKIDVTIDDKMVRVSGSYDESREDKDKRKYFMVSIASSFDYSFRLPQGVVANREPGVEFERGVLRMIFPKLKKQAPKKI